MTKIYDILRRTACLMLAVLLCGCTASTAEQGAAGQSSAGAPEALPEGANALLEQMTLNQKVGQLFVVRPDALDPGLSQDEIDDAESEGVTHVTEEMARTLERIPVGGVVLFGKNLQSPEQLPAFIEELQAAGGGALFMAVDEEGGLVARLANHPAFRLPQYASAADVGAEGEEAALEMGSTIGGYLKEYGFNLNFAPVADVY